MNKHKRYMIFILVDTIIIFSAVFCSYFLLSEKVSSQYIVEIPYIFMLFWLTMIGGFYYVKLYNRLWRYASIGEVILLTKTSIASLFTIFILHFLLNNFLLYSISYSMFLLAWMIIILGVFTSRFIVRILEEFHRKTKTNRKRVLIVGAGSAGTLVVKELQKSVDRTLYPVAFLDDDIKKLNLQIMGIPVVGTRKDLLTTVKKFKIDMIIIAIPSAPGVEIRKVVNMCNENNIQVKILPRISDLLNGRISLNMIKDVKVEDLLKRPPIKLDLQGIVDKVSDKTVLVTGAGGSIGSEICRQVAQYNPKKILLLGHGENSIYSIEKELKRTYSAIPLEAIIADIQDRNRMENIFVIHSPSIVFHAAAHKHVPLMEENLTEAIKNNIFGTKIVAECSNKYLIEQFVLISTDKAVNPTSVMGVTKRVAEMLIQILNEKSQTKFVAVRFGNVLGSRGSVIPLFKQQIKEGGPVTVTHPDMTRYFMTIPEAVQLVIQACAFAKGGEIFILDMGQPIKISDLAADLITLSGFIPDKDIKIEYTGIRPGEKLFEEILTLEEGNFASKHQLIYIAKPTKLAEIDFMFSLEKLEDLVQNVESTEILNSIKLQLKRIVPTYHPTI